MYWLYANINDIPIPNHSAKSIALQQNITNLQPFNQHRRKQKVNNDSTTTNDDIDDTDEGELYNDKLLKDGSRKKRKINWFLFGRKVIDFWYTLLIKIFEYIEDNNFFLNGNRIHAP